MFRMESGSLTEGRGNVLSSDQLPELRRLFSDADWSQSLINAINVSGQPLLDVIRFPNVDLQVVKSLLLDKTVPCEKLNSLFSLMHRELLRSGYQKWMSSEILLRVMKCATSMRKQMNLLGALYDRLGDEYIHHVDELFDGALSEKKISLLATEYEKVGLSHLANLANRVGEVLKQYSCSAPDRETTYQAESNLDRLTFQSMMFHGLHSANNSAANLSDKLDQLRKEDFYQAIRSKIISDSDPAICADEAIYFAMITDEPELINIYDLKQCIRMVNDSRIKLSLEIIAGLRARTDDHFTQYGLKLLDETRAAQSLYQDKDPLFVTRLYRKIDNIAVSLRQEPYYQSLVMKVQENQNLSDEENLFFALVSGERLSHLGALALDWLACNLNRLNLDEPFQSEVEENIRLLISLRGYVSVARMVDPALMAKLYERGALAYRNNSPVVFLNLQKVNLLGINLIGSDALMYADLQGANLDYAQLDKACSVNFSGASMRYAKIYNRVGENFSTWADCHFDAADLSFASLDKPCFNHCHFRRTNFEGATIVLPKGYSDAHFDAVNFNGATLKNFDQDWYRVKHASLVGAHLYNSERLYQNEDAIDEMFSFVDMVSLNDELNKMFETVTRVAGDRLSSANAANQQWKHDLRLAAARHIKKRVMSDAFVDPVLRRDLIDAACEHALFQPENPVMRVTNDAVTFAQSKVHGWFSRGVDLTHPWHVSPALGLLVELRDELRVNAAANRQ